VIEVLHPGPLSTIQDLGRPGLAHLGIPGSGAADQRSLALANRMVGNPEGAPAIETTLVGPKLRFLADASVAITGAAVSVRRLPAGEELDTNVRTHIHAREELLLGTATSGLRSYIAVTGGLDVAPVLGSASTDLLTGLGPPRLRAGDRLAIGASVPTPSPDVPSGLALETATLPAAPGHAIRLGVGLGPRADWFSSDSLREFLNADFEVTPSSNRVGLRLRGPALRRTRDQELPSEGLVRGAIQVPPDGHPIILGPDHPTTGGYPVIAVVLSDELSMLGQLRPGLRVRFLAVELR
jgi:biotin-dependent carboxylase-like uncharacterized protein